MSQHLFSCVVLTKALRPCSCLINRALEMSALCF